MIAPLHRALAALVLLLVGVALAPLLLVVPAGPAESQVTLPPLLTTTTTEPAPGPTDTAPPSTEAPSTTAAPPSSEAPPPVEPPPVTELAPPAPEEPPPAVEPAVPAGTGVASGKGMFIWQWEPIGSPAAVVERAAALRINFLVVRAADADDGFYLADVLAELLPRAHAAGIAVIAYDPPQWEPVEADVQRAIDLMNYRAPSGDAIDAFAADIEPPRKNATADNADRYGALLRNAAGPTYPLVAIVYPPQQFGWFPYAELAPHFDVFMPMDYWRATTVDAYAYVTRDLEILRPYGLPVSILGQAFGFGRQQDPPLDAFPPRAEIRAAIQAARDGGAIGVSFWVWQSANDEFWSEFGVLDWPPGGEPIFYEELPPIPGPPAPTSQAEPAPPTTADELFRLEPPESEVIPPTTLQTSTRAAVTTTRTTRPSTTAVAAPVPARPAGEPGFPLLMALVGCAAVGAATMLTVHRRFAREH